MSAKLPSHRCGARRWPVLIFMLAIIASGQARAYETTQFSVRLNNPAQTGTFAIGNTRLGNGTTSITPGSTVYNVAYQYFTPTVGGRYAFGQLIAPVDTVVMLYSPVFASSAPTTNFIALNDDNNIANISNPGLRAYAQANLGSRSCGGVDSLCPLLEANLIAGTDYYVVVSTYVPGASLGTPADTLQFFVIGDALVGVGGVPPPAGPYVRKVEGTGVAGLARYFDDNDDDGGVRNAVATYLAGATPRQVEDALKVIFPSTISVVAQTTSAAGAQTTGVLIDKVGTVLGDTDDVPLAALATGGAGIDRWMFGGQAGGEYGLAFAQSSLAQSDLRLRPERSGAGEAIYALSSMPYRKFTAGDQAVWMQGVASAADGSQTSRTLGYDTRSAGIVTGYEHAFSPATLGGLLFSAFDAEIELDDRAGETDALTYSAGIYGQHLIGSLKLTGVVLGSYSQFDSERNIAFGGVSASPRAEYEAFGTSTTIGISQLFKFKGLKIEPYGSANYATIKSDAFSETGGGAFNMSVSGDRSSTASVQAGVTFAKEFDVGRERSLRLKLRPYLGYRREIEEADNFVRIAGASSETVINGRDFDAGQVGIAFEGRYAFDDRNSLKLGVDLSHDRNEDAGIFYLGYGFKF